MSESTYFATYWDPTYGVIPSRVASAASQSIHTGPRAEKNALRRTLLPREQEANSDG